MTQGLPTPSSRRRPGSQDKKSLASELYVRHLAGMKGGWVYIMTNKPDGVLYIGVCADVVARVAQHREGKGSAFCKRYNLRRLVYVEPYPTIDEAIRREKAMKEWLRAWKVRRIEAMNPDWDDLWPTILG